MVIRTLFWVFVHEILIRVNDIFSFLNEFLVSSGVHGLEALDLLYGEGPGSGVLERFADDGVFVYAGILLPARDDLHEGEEAQGGPIEHVLLVGCFARVGIVSVDAVSKEGAAGDVAVLGAVDLHASVAGGHQLGLLRQGAGAPYLLVQHPNSVVRAGQA